MKVLNLYSGLGGNRKLWEDVKVTAVELDEKIAGVYAQLFPTDHLVIGDAHQYLIEHADEFDFIWSSPPCQTHSKMMKATRHKRKRYSDLSLYEEILFLQNFYKGGWVVENVKPYYEPLIKPTQSIGRHLFWSNSGISSNFHQDNHPNFIQAESPAEVQSMKDWLGLNYEGNIYYKGNHSPAQVLRNCVHPKLGLHVFNSINNNQLVHHSTNT